MSFGKSDWETLVKQRWGEAVNTADPSIIIDVPDPDRRWAVLNLGKQPIPPRPEVKSPYTDPTRVQ